MHNGKGGWLLQKRALLFAFSAFAVPFLVRAIPELLMGQYLVGFDPMGYYVPNTLLWLRNGVSFGELIASAPLFYLILMGLTSVGAPILVSLKILGPLILGLLGFVVYQYAHKALSWTYKKSLLVAVLGTLYFVALRISWDMFRSELALVFLFLSLILLSQTGHEKRNGVLLALTLALLVLSHQLVAVIAFAIIASLLLRSTFKRQKTEFLRITASAIPAALLFASIAYFNYVIFAANSSGGINPLTNSHLYLVLDTFGFLVFCYLPLVPLLIFTVRRFRGDFPLKVWMIWIFIPVLLAVIVPNGFFVGGVLPYRWILLLTYPLSFYAVEALSRIKWSGYKVAVGFALVLLSTGFLVLPNNEAVGYLDTFTSYGPKTMLQNTIQLSDCQDTMDNLFWAQNNLRTQGRLLVHEAFYGYAVLTFDNSRIEPYFFDNLTDVTEGLNQNNSTASLYLIWWVNGSGWYGQPTVPLEFEEIHHSGNIAIYRYVAPY